MVIFSFYGEKNEGDEAWMFVMSTLYFFMESVCTGWYSCPQGAIAPSCGGIFLLMPNLGNRKKKGVFSLGFYFKFRASKKGRVHFY